VASLAEAYGSGRWEGDRDSWPRRSMMPTGGDSPSIIGSAPTGAVATSAPAPSSARAAIWTRPMSIVANHDLVLADLSLGGGVVLPTPGDCIYVFDEGHHLPDKALNHFAHRFACGRCAALACAP
jgi:ATP-dependent DNA helicase DinG